MADKKTFIRYQNRNPKHNDIVYGTLCTPERVDKIKVNNEKWLGRVIDKEKRIFFRRDIGYYELTMDNEFRALENKELETHQKADKCKRAKKGTVKKENEEKNRVMVHLGVSYLIYSYIIKENLNSLFNFTSPQERDSILSLLIYRISERADYCFAQEWWESNILKYFCPYAKLQSQRISELLARIGTEKFFREFFTNYLSYIQDLHKSSSVLIDSTGLPNAVNCPYTAINNHNVVISNEIRLISVLDRESGFPIYYRYVPGNIVDVTTLKTTLYELQEYGVNINRLVLDADYYSEENLTELYNSNIPFMTRIASRYSIYDLLVKKYVPDIVKPANFVEYGNRKLFIIKDKINLFHGEIPAFVYICLDEETKHKEYLDYLGKTRLDNISDEKFRFDLLKQGIFIIVSTIDLKNSEVLPCYYSRQSVEQFFDYLQNDIDLLPLRTHSEKTFSGHIMISFISTIIYYSIDKKLKAKGISLSNYLHSIKLLIGRIYKNTIIPAVPTKRINDVLKALKITLPTRIFLDEL